MNNCKDKSYRYGEKTYHLNEHQLEVLRQVRRLPRKYLHYIVVQQSDSRPNINLKQMKSSIKRAVKDYVSNPLDRLKEIDKVQYLCVFETTKDFHLSQFNNRLNEEDFYLGLHAHIFITSPDDYPWVDFNFLSHQIFKKLSSYPQRQTCIGKYDYMKVDKLNNPFILYHTKQLYQSPSREMVLSNVA